MDEIAARAGVSKQTVYKHFAGKERLFAEIVSATVDEVSEAVYEEVLELDDSGDLEADLRRPRAPAARRGDAAAAAAAAPAGDRRGGPLPGAGPDLLRARARPHGRRAGRPPSSGWPSGARCALDDPPLAAHHFNWLVMSIPLNQAMLLGTDEPPSPADLDRYAAAGVRVFLAAYAA